MIVHNHSRKTSRGEQQTTAGREPRPGQRGTWITAAEATDPDYWVAHLLRPVRFGAGLAEIWSDPGRAGTDGRSGW